MADEFEREDSEQYESAAYEPESYESESSESEDSALLDAQSGDLEPETGIADDDLEASVMVLEEVDIALVLPVWEPTGDAQVDAALEILATLDELSVHDHAEVLTSVHSSLHQRLTDISA